MGGPSSPTSVITDNKIVEGIKKENEKKGVLGTVHGAIKGTVNLTKTELKNVSGIQDKENQAKRAQQAFMDTINQMNAPKTEDRPTPGKISGQTDTLSASQNEEQRRRLINQLRFGIASTIQTGRNNLGLGGVSTPMAQNAKTLLGQ